MISGEETKNRLQYTPCRGRVHVTSRSTIPIRFAYVERRKTPVFVRFGVQKHVAFQVGLYCNKNRPLSPKNEKTGLTNLPIIF